MDFKSYFQDLNDFMTNKSGLKDLKIPFTHTDPVDNTLIKFFEDVLWKTINKEYFETNFSGTQAWIQSL